MIKALSPRELLACKARASSSLPVPLSPRINTADWVADTLRTKSRSRRIGELEPMMSVCKESRPLALAVELAATALSDSGES